MLIRNQLQEANQWLEENIHEFGMALGNQIYFIHDRLFDLFLERIRKEVVEDYGKSNNSSIKIINMTRTKNTSPNPEQPPQWFKDWLMIYQKDMKKIQSTPPKWFKDWCNGPFLMFVENVNKKFDDIYCILKRNNIN